MKAEQNPRAAEPMRRTEFIRMHRAESTSRTEPDKLRETETTGRMSSQSESEITYSQSESEMDPKANVKAFPRVKARRFPSESQTVSQGYGGARAIAKGW